jgi:hypothetical protein
MARVVTVGELAAMVRVALGISDRSAGTATPPVPPDDDSRGDLSVPDRSAGTATPPVPPAPPGNDDDDPWAGSGGGDLPDIPDDAPFLGGGMNWDATDGMPDFADLNPLPASPFDEPPDELPDHPNPTTPPSQRRRQSVPAVMPPPPTAEQDDLVDPFMTVAFDAPNELPRVPQQYRRFRTVAELATLTKTDLLKVLPEPYKSIVKDDPRYERRVGRPRRDYKNPENDEVVQWHRKLQELLGDYQGILTDSRIRVFDPKPPKPPKAKHQRAPSPVVALPLVALRRPDLVEPHSRRPQVASLGPDEVNDVAVAFPHGRAPDTVRDVVAGADGIAGGVFFPYTNGTFGYAMAGSDDYGGVYVIDSDDYDVGVIMAIADGNGGRPAFRYTTWRPSRDGIDPDGRANIPTMAFVNDGDGHCSAAPYADYAPWMGGRRAPLPVTVRRLATAPNVRMTTWSNSVYVMTTTPVVPRQRLLVDYGVDTYWTDEAQKQAIRTEKAAVVRDLTALLGAATPTRATLAAHGTTFCIVSPPTSPTLLFFGRRYVLTGVDVDVDYAQVTMRWVYCLFHVAVDGTRTEHWCDVVVPLQLDPRHMVSLPAVLAVLGTSACIGAVRAFLGTGFRGVQLAEPAIPYVVGLPPTLAGVRGRHITGDDVVRRVSFQHILSKSLAEMFDVVESVADQVRPTFRRLGSRAAYDAAQQALVTAITDSNTLGLLFRAAAVVVVNRQTHWSVCDVPDHDVERLTTQPTDPARPLQPVWDELADGHELANGHELAAPDVMRERYQSRVAPLSLEAMVLATHGNVKDLLSQRLLDNVAADGGDSTHVSNVGNFIDYVFHALENVLVANLCVDAPVALAALRPQAGVLPPTQDGSVAHAFQRQLYTVTYGDAPPPHVENPDGRVVRVRLPDDYYATFCHDLMYGT